MADNRNWSENYRVGDSYRRAAINQRVRSIASVIRVSAMPGTGSLEMGSAIVPERITMRVEAYPHMSDSQLSSIAN